MPTSRPCIEEYDRTKIRSVHNLSGIFSRGDEETCCGISYRDATTALHPFFFNRPVPREVIESCLASAGTAPSGANLQPWHFVVVSDPAIKRQIREAAEKEEYEFHHGRASQEWLDALAPLGVRLFLNDGDSLKNQGFCRIC
jgi:Nitroreductase family